MSPYILPGEHETLVAAHEAAHPLVVAARALGGLPQPGTLEFIEADVARRQAVLAVLGQAYLVAEPEQRISRALVQASHDVAAGGISPGEPHKAIAQRRDWSARRDGPDYPGGPVELWGPIA